MEATNWIVLPFPDRKEEGTYLDGFRGGAPEFGLIKLAMSAIPQGSNWILNFEGQKRPGLDELSALGNHHRLAIECLGTESGDRERRGVG